MEKTYILHRCNTPNFYNPKPTCPNGDGKIYTGSPELLEKEQRPLNEGMRVVKQRLKGWGHSTPDF
jgi:hypothetical protein